MIILMFQIEVKLLLQNNVIVVLKIAVAINT